MGTWRLSCWLSLGKQGPQAGNQRPRGRVSLPHLVRGPGGLRQVVGGAFPHSCGEPARSPGSSVFTSHLQHSHREAILLCSLAVCCVGGAHSFLGYTLSLWTV